MKRESSSKVHQRGERMPGQRRAGQLVLYIIRVCIPLFRSQSTTQLAIHGRHQKLSHAKSKKVSGQSALQNPVGWVRRSRHLFSWPDKNLTIMWKRQESYVARNATIYPSETPIEISWTSTLDTWEGKPRQKSCESIPYFASDELLSRTVRPVVSILWMTG